jgi:hypothetical protein
LKNTNEKQELLVLINAVGRTLTEDYTLRFGRLLAEHGLYELQNDEPIPFEAWIGMVQAIADASGYRITLEAALLEPIRDEPDTEHIVGYREIATVDPTLFVKPA